MNNYNKLLNNLDILKLFKVKENLETYIDLINNKKKDIVDCLYDLTNLEISTFEEKEDYTRFNLQDFHILKPLKILTFLFNQV